MRAPPFVSIITPSLDPGNSILACIRSVKEQAYPRIEHIVIDGGSSDETLNLLSAASGIRWISEPDEGQSDAINKGFRMASGDLVGWLNADDELLPQAVERISHTYQRQHISEWFYGDCIRAAASGTTILRGPRFLTRWTFELGNRVPQPGALIGADAVSEVGFLDPAFDLAMDFDLWLRLRAAGKRGTYIPQELALFRVHPQSKTGSIPEWRFTFEEATALTKHGKPEAASVVMGRAIARKSLLDPTLLRMNLRDTVAESTQGMPIDIGLAAAAAEIEYALLIGGTKDALRALARIKRPHRLLLRMIGASIKDSVFQRAPTS